MAQSRLRVKNAILNRLSASDLDALGLEPVTLPLRQPLEAANAANQYVYFIEAGVASVVSEISAEVATEIALIGWEGMTGLGMIYGDSQTPFETFMQVKGSGLRCETARLQKVWADSSTLRSAMALYARAFSIQAACTAVVNGRYNLEERLARWLLMVSDRTAANFNITHEFIAVMLAVRRAGVTLAIQSLEGRGFIRASRGTIQIVDRPQLLAFAGGAYGLPEREYERLWEGTTVRDDAQG